METRSASALHPVHRWRRTRGADTISSVSDQIFEFSQRLNRFSAPLLPNTPIQLGTYVEGQGKALFEVTKEKGMEGIIAKRKNSTYSPGRRTSDWLKIKARLQQEFVVGGFTEPKGSRKHLGAVLIGAYCKGKLRHYGYAGSGFTEKGLKEAVDRMKPLITTKSPFANPPKTTEKIHWIRPVLVCEVEYAELTADEQLRQTGFLGWRDDKKAKEVVLEQ
jgi:bifunctional non-homologous end joining protein LigD